MLYGFIAFLFLVSARQGWFVYTSTTGWKWVSAFLTKSTMLPPTSYPQKQSREVWNPSGKSKLCPSEWGQSLLLFPGWCCRCLRWHRQGDGVTGLWRREALGSDWTLELLCGAAGSMVVGCHSLSVHFGWLYSEWPALFAARNCLFILICWPRSNSAFGRKRAQVL